MEHLRFYDLEENYINDNSSLKYFNVSYTKDTEHIWVKEEPYLLMKFKVEEAIIIDDNDDSRHKVLTRKICNDLSVFKSIQIGNDEPINIEFEEKENVIDSNSFILNENDYFESTYIPDININGEQQCTLVINEQFTKDDYIVYFERFNYYPYDNCYSISEMIEYGDITEINENTFEVGNMSNGYIYFVIKKEGVELLYENETITSDMLQYIISSSLKYNEIKNKIYLPSVKGEYMVKGILNQSIDSLNYLFSNNNVLYYEYTENTNIYDDIEINNDYDKNIINLISITIPKQISNLNNTFDNCKKLKEVKIDNQSNLTEIDKCAFRWCNSLTSIDIPNNITSIGDSAFENCYSLSSIEIPSGVTSISGGAFYGCYSLSEITIPNSVTSIGNGAFNNCSSLTSITISNNVTSIEANTFSHCSSLSSITIPNGVTSIGRYAFYECHSLSSIDIPNSVTTIGDYAFYECISLSSIDIPSGVTLIGNDTFEYCYSLSSITIPNGITSIGTSAFEDCSSLSNITIPNSVTEIGQWTFSGCTSLSKITCLATTAPTISSNTFKDICYNGVLYYPQGSDYSSWLSTSSNYLGRNSWVGVELQDAYDFKVNFITNGVRVESPYNSLSINGIQGVKQGDNSYLFSGLQPINNMYEFDLIADGEVIDTVDIRYKNKWITIGDNSTMLTCIYNPCQSTRIYSGSNLTYSGAYVDGVYKGKLSSSYTFNDVSEHIIQYSGVTSIRGGVFYYCRALNSVIIPNGVTSISSSAFTNCYVLSSIDIPNSVTSIGASAFTNCYSLTSITIPNTVTSISEGAFYYCRALREIKIPSGVTSIGNGTFKGCESLSSIEIPNGVTKIGNEAFRDCSSLREITIGNSVTSIGDNVFAYSYSLNEITCLAETAPTVSSDTFSNISSLGVLYYPGLNSSYDAWKQYLPNWDFVPL